MKLSLSLSFVTALIAAVSVTVAAPTEPLARDAIPVNRRAINSLEDALADVARAKSKVYTAMNNYKANYGHYPPGANVSALEEIGRGLQNGGILATRIAGLLKRQTAQSITLTDQMDQEFWSGPEFYGTPKQGAFQLDHDTGSSDLILNPGTYNPAGSSTAKNTGTNFTIAYGDGTTASGPVYTDNFYIAKLSAKNQAIGVTTGAANLPASGISGMAFKSISTFKQNPFFYNLVAQAKIPDVFAFALRQTAGASKLYLGGYDQSSYKGKITNVKVDNSNGFWQVAGSIQGFSTPTSIIDTGTTVIILPIVQFLGACLSIPGATVVPQGSELACAVTGTVPSNVKVNFGGTDYTLSPQSLVVAEQDGLKYLGIFGDAVLGLETGAIYGDTFLQNVLAIFKGVTGSSPSIGFAPAAQA